MIYHNIQQNTDEWYQLRLGKFTASMFKDVMAKETTATYTNVIYQVVYEKLTGEITNGYTNEWMERGKELEPEARLWYELNFDEVLNGGFFCDDWVGASPDGLIGTEGLIEIKCPKPSTHIQYLIDNELPSIYQWQVQGQLFVTNRKWCDFVSYHPRIKPLVIRVNRDEELISELKTKLDQSIQKAKQILEIVNG